MKARFITFFTLASLGEGILTLYTLIGMTFTPSRGGIFNYPDMRSGLAGGLLFVVAILAIFSISLFLKPSWGAFLSAWLDKTLVGTKKRLFSIQWLLIVLTVFLVECFFLTYLAFPEPARPLFLWFAILGFQTWLVFRLAYRKHYSLRPGLIVRLSLKWNNCQPVQRKVFVVMAILGLIYFVAFIPPNLLPDKDGVFQVQGDEQVLYPDVTNGMVFPPTVSGLVHSVLEQWPWQYGYPYFIASAAILLVPRLVLGEQFASHIQLNLFLLRQFVNVLPMVVTIILAVFLATRFKNLLTSAGAFVFLALVPGLVKMNIQFWHPDVLIVLLVVLTIYALQKDDLRFGRYFYVAAVFCGLAAAIKLWGLFFGPVVAGYLLAGLITRRINLGKLFLSGLLFLLAMLSAIIISSPTLMAPYIARVALRGWLPRQGTLVSGYGPDPGGLYATGLVNWLKYFGFHYMKGYFFFFSMVALILGSFLGSKIFLNRLLLGWCVVVTVFLAYFVALKNFQYMLPLAIPLYIAAFNFPALTDGLSASGWTSFLAKPLAHKVIRGITLAMFASQFAINLVILGLYIFRSI